MSKRNNLKDLINRGNIIHNNKYDYSLLKEHKSMHDIVDIVCSNHGIFKMSLHSHINKKRGCKYCAIDKVTHNKEMFIEKAKIVHGDKYDYSLVDYKTQRITVCIICSEHGIFEQKPFDHIICKNGCPKCKESRGERKIRLFLEKNNINYISQKKFDKLKYKNSLFFDFYLPDYNICIEYDGEHHFKPIKYYGGLETFNKIKERDKLKNEYCNKNNILLLRLNKNDDIENLQIPKRKIKQP